MRILVYRLGSLGDMCVAIPALRRVRTRFPDAHITLLTNLPVAVKAAPAVELLSGSGLVDDYLSYPVGTRNLWVLARLAFRLNRRKFDAVVNLAGWRGARAVRRDELFFRVVGIRRLVGFVPEDTLRLAEAGHTEREAERLARRVATFGHVNIDGPEARSLNLSAAELATGRELLRAAGIVGPFLALSLGCKASANDWTQPNWVRLMVKLGERYRHLGCIIIGSADERSRADELLARWPGPHVNFCGACLPRESAAVLAAARLFIGHDSGPMHLAAAVGVRCIAIFSARNPPGQWFPLGVGHCVFYRRTTCAGCGLETCVTEEKRCILAIKVEEVIETVTTELGPTAEAALHQSVTGLSGEGGRG